jgi:hypothetical protein
MSLHEPEWTVSQQEGMPRLFVLIEKRVLRSHR